MDNIFNKDFTYSDDPSVLFPIPFHQRNSISVIDYIFDLIFIMRIKSVLQQPREKFINEKKGRKFK